MPECLKIDAADSVTEALNQHGQLIVAPVGTSMKPLLHGARDAVVLCASRFPLRKYDVALYRRSNGALVLHRVMKVVEDGYQFCGDHLTELESPICDAQIYAVMTAFFRGERLIRLETPAYWLYCRLWCGSLWPRRCWFALLRPFRRLWRHWRGGDA